MPALLAEDILLFIDVRIEHCVKIDVHQVLEIRVIAARHRIYSLIRVSHRVEKCIERTLYQLNERVLDREIPGAAQYRVLDDMRNAGGIFRRRAESDIEYFIVILTGKKRYSRAGLLVAKKKAVTARVLQVLMLKKVIFFQNTVRNFHKFLTVFLHI